MNLSHLASCCRKFALAGLVASFFRVRCMRSWRPFCCGLPGLMRSMPIPRRSHQTASLLKLNNACAEAKGTPLSLRICAGMIGDGQGVAVAMISQQELALVIGAPELIGTLA